MANQKTEIERVPQKGKFYVITPSFWGGDKGPGLEIANKDKLRLPGTYIIEPPNGNPHQYPEKPHLVHVPKLGGMPRDFEEWASQWVVSEALKNVFESVDLEGFAFAACDFTLADGSSGPQHYLCGIVRTLDALDEEVSTVKIKCERDCQTGEDVKLYSVAGGASLSFKQEIVGNAHIFRQPRLGADAICDRVLFEAVEAAALSGVRLRDAANL